MKAIILVLLSCFLTIPLAAQFGPQRIITTELDLADSSIATDINDNGFMDVIAFGYYGEKIVWFQNMDGLGNFGAEQLIQDGIIGCTGVQLFDLDGDGDDDVIYSSNGDGIRWLENLSGPANYSTPKIIDESSVPYAMTAGDLDNDGDLEVIADLYNLGLVWFENLNGSDDFSTAHLLDNNFFTDFSALRILDFDNDGDNDILTASWDLSPGKIIWYENNQGAFESQQTVYQFQFLSDATSIDDIFLSDLNGDDMVDLLIRTQHDELNDHIYWLERLDAMGNFSEPKFVYFDTNFSGSLQSHDVDNDGDKDILMSIYDENEIVWFENLDGQGNFSSKKIISSEVDRPRGATAADLNGDGDLDIISTSSFDNTIAWYEFDEIFGVDENKANLVTIYPNPITNVINIQSAAPIVQHTLLNTLGQNFFCERNGTVVDVSMIAAGVYFLKVESTNGFTKTFKVVKN